MAFFLSSPSSSPSRILSPLSLDRALLCTPTGSNILHRPCPRSRDTTFAYIRHKGVLPVPYFRCMANKLARSGSGLGNTKPCCTQMLDGHPPRNEEFGPESLNAGILRQLGPETDITAYASLLRHCTSAKALSEGKRVHEHMSRHGYAGNRFLRNLLVQMYSKCGSLENARAVFDKTVDRNVCSWNIMIAASAQNGSLNDARALFANIPQKDVVSWNVMITACAEHGHGTEALQLFRQMQTEGFEPNKVTFICILDACASVAALEEGRRIHAIVVGNVLETDIVVGTSLINMYGKCTRLDDARAVFTEMPQWNVVSWNAVTAACSQNGHGKEALELLDQMQAEGFEPDMVTFICIVDGCASVAALDEGRVIHATITGNGWELDIFVGNALVKMYGKCGILDDARAVFAEMPQRGVVSWSAMLAACTQNGHGKEALQLFAEMQDESLELDKFTFNCIVDACAGVAALEEGQVIHATVAGNGWESEVVAGNALVNMYAKCGSLDDSTAVFAEMPQRDVVSWSAMIAACSQNGHVKEALQLFGQMQAEGFEPDDITFISVLTACSHTGLVADARQYFDSMKRDYGITPSVEHYVCMIDLLGRRGLLEEAEGLIISMPYQHVPSAWLSLLSSCRIHNDVERAVRAANLVSELDPGNASPYLMLPNIHDNAGK